MSHSSELTPRAVRQIVRTWMRDQAEEENSAMASSSKAVSPKPENIVIDAEPHHLEIKIELFGEENDDSAGIKCEICHKTFKLVKYLRAHTARMHTRDNDPLGAKCCRCDKVFHSAKNLQDHTRRQHEEYYCRLCLQSIPLKSKNLHILKVHSKPSKTERYDKMENMQCHICSSVMRNKYTLQEHMVRCHSLFFCCYKNCHVVCPLPERVQHLKTYHAQTAATTARVLKSGLNGDTSHECTACDLKGLRWDQLRKHYRRVHALYYCNYGCNKTVELSASKAHVKNVHQEPRTIDNKFECRLCPKSYTKMNIVSAHRKRCHNRFYCYLGCQKFIGYHEKSVHLASVHNFVSSATII